MMEGPNTSKLLQCISLLSALHLTLLAFQGYNCQATAIDWPENTPVAGTTGPLRLLTILGDSYSDLGKSRDAEISLFKLSGGKLFDPKFFPERSHGTGPNWGGQLHAMIPDLSVRSYAVAAATACAAHNYRFVNPEIDAQLPPVPSVQEQAKLYLADAKSRVLSRRRAVAIWAGTNDIFSGLMNDPDGDGPEQPALLTHTELHISNAVSCLVGTVHTLVAAGERRVIVFTLNPLDDMPMLAPLADFLRQQVVPMFNLKLEAMLELVQNDFPDASISFLDTHSLLKALKDNPAALGITNTTHPCMEPKDANKLSDNPYIPARPPCKNPDQHMFFDPVHYSTIVQRDLIARSFVALLESSGAVDKQQCKGKGCEKS